MTGRGALLLLITLSAAAGCASRGREVFIREGCVNCHRFKELGGGPGPALDGVATRRDGASIRAQITRPSGPGSRMPAFGRLSWVDLHSLVAYFRS